jgi:tRNA (cmo5U34)-methyltransferase
VTSETISIAATLAERPVANHYAPPVGQYHWDPAGYLELMRSEVPAYERLQAQTVAATAGLDARSILELGTGTGETARRLLDAHPHAHLRGIDASPEMLEVAVNTIDPQRARLDRGRLEDPLPDGPFDLIVSALAVHHLDGAAKQDLFVRARATLRDGGRLVLADVVVPGEPADAVTPIDDGYDVPSSVAEQLTWLRQAGFLPRVHWTERDLAVLVGDTPRR